MPQRATKTSFPKGKSGNPKGMAVVPKAIMDERREARELCQLLTPRAVAVYERGLEHNDLALAVMCADRIIDRGWGRVVEKKEITGAEGGAIRIEDNTPSIKILLQSALGPLIEGEKE